MLKYLWLLAVLGGICSLGAALVMSVHRDVGGATHVLYLSGIVLVATGLLLNSSYRGGEGV